MEKPWIQPAMPPPRGVAEKGPGIRLKRDHPTSTAFLDESGIISADRFFSVGLVKTRQAPKLLRAIQKLRDTNHWYQEIKWTSIKANSVASYKNVIDICFSDPELIEFWCFVADRDKADPIERFGSQWDAYGKLAEQLTVASLHPDELIAIMADNYSTPDHILFEEDLKSAVNRRLKRLAAVSVVRLDSRSSDGLQVADLLTSGITFEFRQDANLASANSPKAEVAQYLRNAIGCGSCLKGWRNGKHSIQIFNKGETG
ncbi:MAG: DUF3800 domain-containing protein [Acidimicrobiales bacterium]